jgi:hypothetical protein
MPWTAQQQRKHIGDQVAVSFSTSGSERVFLPPRQRDG